MQVELFVANLTPEWEAPGTFRTAMDAQGEVVRCFIMRNPEGQSKVRPGACSDTSALPGCKHASQARCSVVCLAIVCLCCLLSLCRPTSKCAHAQVALRSAVAHWAWARRGTHHAGWHHLPPAGVGPGRPPAWLLQDAALVGPVQRVLHGLGGHSPNSLACMRRACTPSGWLACKGLRMMPPACFPRRATALWSLPRLQLPRAPRR